MLQIWIGTKVGHNGQGVLLCCLCETRCGQVSQDCRCQGKCSSLGESSKACVQAKVAIDFA